VFVHHKSTGEVDIRHAGEFIQRSKSRKVTLQTHLHYTNKLHSHVCRCTDPGRHGLVFTVASDSARLAADLTRFLGLHHLIHCSMTEFRDYGAELKAKWQDTGIKISDFHYATKQKDVVCRCTKPNNHGQGPVRNTEITEPCAVFFHFNQGRMTCTKAQWRTVSTSPQPASVREVVSVQTDPCLTQEASKYLGKRVPTPRPEEGHVLNEAVGKPVVPEARRANDRPSIYGNRHTSNASHDTAGCTSVNRPPTAVTTTPGWVTPRDLEGTQPPSDPRPGTSSSLHVEEHGSRASQSTYASTSLTAVFDKAHDVLNLPDQEELLLRHVLVCSRANPAPSGNCKLCEELYDDRSMRTIQLPVCGHYVHQQCLLTDFRIRDSAIGLCPICDLALCKRDTADRIDTDRVAIFGSKFTKLRTEVRVEFLQRGETVRLQSEEEVAAAHLRLFKDYVDMLAAESWRRWDFDQTEPDWHIDIIRWLGRARAAHECNKVGGAEGAR
jgi:hypothetical protein